MTQINITKKITVEAKTIKIHCKVSDRFTASIIDPNGKEIFSQDDGYVPGFMPGDHYGDYLILDIDLEAGTIVNWSAPSAEQLKEWMSDE